MAVDTFLGIKPGNKSSDKSKYVSSQNLDFENRMVSKEACRQSRHHKSIHDFKVGESQILPGDRVLLCNVGLKGKNKFADKW